MRFHQPDLYRRLDDSSINQLVIYKFLAGQLILDTGLRIEYYEAVIPSNAHNFSILLKAIAINSNIRSAVINENTVDIESTGHVEESLYDV